MGKSSDIRVTLMFGCFEIYPWRIGDELLLKVLTESVV